VVRRAVDHVDLRPVRGERPLLPVAASRTVRGRSRSGARARPDPAAGRAPAAQRHNLAVEPTGLRRGRRQATPAGGEPRAARRADRGGHDGQRGVLLRHAADALGRGPATVDEDELRCGTTYYRRGRTAWDGGAAVLARSWRGDTRRVGAAQAVADGRRGSA